MNSVEFINFTKGSPNVSKTDFKPNSIFSSFSYDRIMEKAIIQRENKGALKDIDKPKKQSDFKLMNKEIIVNQQADNKESVKSETFKNTDSSENLIEDGYEDVVKSEIESLLAMLSGILNLSRQDIENIEHILCDSSSSIGKSEPVNTSVLDNIRNFLQENDILSEEEIDNVIEQLGVMKQKFVTTKNVKEESDLDKSHLKNFDGLTEDKGIHKLTSFDSPIQAPKSSMDGKTEALMPSMAAKLTDNGSVSDKIDNNEQEDSGNHKDQNIIVDLLAKKSELVEKPSSKIKINAAVGAEYITTDEKNYTITDNIKPALKNLEHVERTQNISKEELLSQIIENSKVVDNQDASEIRIQLKPDSLGKLTIRLIMEKGEMTAKFIAENHRVKEVIESNFSELRDALSQKGINIQSLSVSVGQQGKWQYENQNFKAWKNNIKRSHYAANSSLETATNVMDYDNPYNVSDGLVDIKV